MKTIRVIVLSGILAIFTAVSALPPPGDPSAAKPTEILSMDDSTFIDANQVIMVVTNHGSFGRDEGNIFHYDAATFFPYEGDTSIIINNLGDALYRSPLYHGGIWLAGIDSASEDLVVAISEYSSEFVPGPMENGTFMPDNPAFKVYKLYYDSLSTSPNDDFLIWPTDQGAPADESGNPIVYGRQMLWSVYNDADPDAHDNHSGQTAPLGIEVQQTTWAGDEPGDDTIYYNRIFDVSQIGYTDLEVTAWAADPSALTGDDYRIIFEDTTFLLDCGIAGVHYGWHLDNVSTGERLLWLQCPNTTSEMVEGIRIRLRPEVNSQLPTYIPPDTFTFTADPPPFYTGTLEGSSIYFKYKFYNRGGKTIKDMYFALWTDPDLGWASDDLVGCDTLDDIGFCYNFSDVDDAYGFPPPAIGTRLLYGPLVPSPDSTAVFDTDTIADHRNLNMTAFNSFIGSQDPERPFEIYDVMQGLDRSGNPYVYEGDTLTCRSSGDPVTGTGDVEAIPSDYRMLTCCGPFDFRPGDSQFVLVKLAVAQGTDRLNSITELRSILNEPFDPMVDTSTGEPPPQLPGSFWVGQNYPNPFNPLTTIEYNLPRPSRVTIDIYNILGQKVRRLVDAGRVAGPHRVDWDGTNQDGEAVATGLYFYRVQAGRLVDSKKMLLLK